MYHHRHRHRHHHHRRHLIDLVTLTVVAAELKNTWSYTLAPSYAFMVCTETKVRLQYLGYNTSYEVSDILFGFVLRTLFCVRKILLTVLFSSNVSVALWRERPSFTPIQINGNVSFKCWSRRPGNKRFRSNVSTFNFALISSWRQLQFVNIVFIFLICSKFSELWLACLTTY